VNAPGAARDSVPGAAREGGGSAAVAPPRRSRRALAVGALLAIALPPLLLLSLRTGNSGSLELAVVWQGCRAAFGRGEELPRTLQVIVELRLWRALTTAGVGAALALSGALLQGLFRNALASPSVLGVTGGASLGATLAILAIGGGAPLLLAVDGSQAGLLVPLCAFLGATGAVTLVLLLAGAGGRISAPTLLLTGIALNSVIAGVLALLSALALRDWEVSRAILSWTFGTLDDRSDEHVQTIFAGLGLALLVVPFVSWELDLLQSGEEDARSLGVHTLRVRVLCIAGSSLAAASAVAVAGQIAFVGLVVPHLVRLVTGRGHRSLLLLSPLAGAVFLLAVEWGQRALLGDRALPPGVMMALVGGPFFLGLLLWQRRELDTW
jgi:iron complex transport system permease protein